MAATFLGALSLVIGLSASFAPLSLTAPTAENSFFVHVLQINS